MRAFPLVFLLVACRFEGPPEKADRDNPFVENDDDDDDDDDDVPEIEPAEVSPQALCSSHIDVDWSDDGDIDQFRDLEYDRWGNQVWLEWDDDADGTPEGWQESAWDADGNMTYDAQDWDGDDIENYAVMTSFTADGREDVRTTDGNGDGFFEDTWTSIVWDAHGNTLQAEQDWDGDTVTDALWRYIRADDGTLLRFEGDYFQDGVVDYVIDVAVDGDRVEYEYDWDNDGTVDAIYIYEWIELDQMRPAYQYVDENADGVPEYEVTMLWNEEQTVIEEQITHQFGFDGTLLISQHEWLEYDELDRREFGHIEIDDRADGTVETFVAWHQTWSCPGDDGPEEDDED